MPTYPHGATDVTTAEGGRQAMDQLSNAREMAVDAEADALHAFRPRLCFIQVGTDADVFLFDTLSSEFHAKALGSLFGDPGRTKFFHAAGGDLQYLAEAGVRVKGLFDTHRAATLLGWPKVGLADLARERLGVELRKEHQQADFSIRPLPAGMREYIADDVRYLSEIGRQMREECRKSDILEEVELDCQRMADEALSRPEIGTDFRVKLPGMGPADAHRALGNAIAQSLHRVRLKWAEETDVPLGRMLSNAAIAALATHPPDSMRDLARTRGVRGPFVREHGEEVLGMLKELIDRQKRGDLPDESADREPRDPRRRKREEALRAFRVEKAGQRKVTPSAVLSNPLIGDLAKNPPSTLEQLAATPYLGEKRLNLYGSEILTLMAPLR